MPEDETAIIFAGDKAIPVKIGEKKTLAEMEQELYNMIESINERKKRASIDYTRSRLEKAAELCNDIIRERSWQKGMLR